MNRVLLTLLLAALTITPTSAEKKDGSKDRLLRLEQEWAAAEAKGDKVVLDRILADEYTFTDLDGKAGTKKELLANLQTPAGPASSADPKSAGNYEVREYGSAAVVTHNAVFKGQSDGKDVTVEARGLDVWVKQGDNWRVVAHQWTVVSGPRGNELPREFLARCAKMAFQPEVHTLYGNAAVVLGKLENDTMGLPDRRGYLLLIETDNSAELSYFDRITAEGSKVYHWQGRSASELREKLTNYILANRGVACVGAQTKALVRASVTLSDEGQIPTPLSATAAFSHMIRMYGDNYIRVTVLLLC